MKILVVDGVDKKAVEMLRKEYEVKEADLDAASLLKEIPEYHALMVRSKSKVTAEVIEAGKNLKVIGRAGAGVDNIDV
ncbi:MAG: phosphoglycerate dehydrogenase, partial [Thermoplasmata archaeon]